MQLSYGMSVVSSDGENLGQIKELIVDPRHRIVTHLVVRQGLFFSHDRVVSAEHLQTTAEGAVKLNLTAQEAERASQAYLEDQYVDLEDEAFIDRYGVGGAVWRRPTGEFGGAGLTSLIPPGIGPIPPEPEVAIPDGEVSLRKGAEVMTADSVALGRLEEFLTDDNEQITHIIISEGQVFTESKQLPVDWIRKFNQDEIVLGVPLSVVEKL